MVTGKLGDSFLHSSSLHSMAPHFLCIKSKDVGLGWKEKTDFILKAKLINCQWLPGELHEDIERRKWLVMSFVDKEWRRPVATGLDRKAHHNLASSYPSNLIFPVSQIRIFCWSKNLTQPSHWTTCVSFLLLFLSFLLLCFLAENILHDSLHPSNPITGLFLYRTFQTTTAHVDLNWVGIDHKT